MAYAQVGADLDRMNTSMSSSEENKEFFRKMSIFTVVSLPSSHGRLLNIPTQVACAHVGADFGHTFSKILLLPETENITIERLQMYPLTIHMNIIPIQDLESV